MPPRTLAHGALLGLSLVAPACNLCEKLPSGASDDRTGPGQAPRLVDGRFVSPSVVELAFSEPLASVDAVDPEKFRLSIVNLETRREKGKCQRTVEYCDLSSQFDAEDGCTAGYGGYYYGDVGGYYGDPPLVTRVTALELVADDPSRLELRLSDPIEQLTCLEVGYAHAAGIHAFFSAGDVPTIVDRDGEQLADIAPHWVLSGLTTDTRDGFDALHHWQPIPCPEQF